METLTKEERVAMVWEAYKNTPDGFLSDTSHWTERNDLHLPHLPHLADACIQSDSRQDTTEQLMVKGFAQQWELGGAEI